MCHDEEANIHLALKDTRELFRGVNGLADSYDLVSVGAALSGSVIAEQAS